MRRRQTSKVPLIVALSVVLVIGGYAVFGRMVSAQNAQSTVTRQDMDVMMQSMTGMMKGMEGMMKGMEGMHKECAEMMNSGGGMGKMMGGMMGSSQSSPGSSSALGRPEGMSEEEHLSHHRSG